MSNVLSRLYACALPLHSAISLDHDIVLVNSSQAECVGLTMTIRYLNRSPNHRRGLSSGTHHEFIVVPAVIAWWSFRIWAVLKSSLDEWDSCTILGRCRTWNTVAYYENIHVRSHNIVHGEQFEFEQVCKLDIVRTD